MGGANLSGRGLDTIVALIAYAYTWWLMRVLVTPIQPLYTPWRLKIYLNIIIIIIFFLNIIMKILLKWKKLPDWCPCWWTRWSLGRWGWGTSWCRGPPGGTLAKLMTTATTKEGMLISNDPLLCLCGTSIVTPACYGDWRGGGATPLLANNDDNWYGTDLLRCGTEMGPLDYILGRMTGDRFDYHLLRDHLSIGALLHWSIH